MKKYSDIEGDGGSRIVEQVGEMTARLNRRLKKIRHKVAVVSGKGGVGKSVVTANIAATMAQKGYKVGVLDADINGSSIPHLLGTGDAEPARSESGIAPLAGVHGIRVMSIDFFLNSHEDIVKWNGPPQTHTWLGAMEASALRELLADTEWGELDYLFIDTPPVLSRVNDLAGFCPGLNGAVIVTIPSEISYRIVLKTIARVKELGIPVIGLVENMKGYTCVHCGGHNKLFDGQEMKEAVSYMVPYLGSVPFDDAASTVSQTESGTGRGRPFNDAFTKICEKGFGQRAAKAGRTGG
jgi:ATP-binding protein involved in chromosome partitioning